MTIIKKEGGNCVTLQYSCTNVEWRSFSVWAKYSSRCFSIQNLNCINDLFFFFSPLIVSAGSNHCPNWMSIQLPERLVLCRLMFCVDGCFLNDTYYVFGIFISFLLHISAPLNPRREIEGWDGKKFVLLGFPLQSKYLFPFNTPSSDTTDRY